MFPSLSPPTDSLYKFISLFGLAIFILASYKSGKTFETYTKNKVSVQAVKKEIRLAVSRNMNNAAMQKVKQFPDQPDALLYEVEMADLPLMEKVNFDGEIRKLKAESNSLLVRLAEYVLMVTLGMLLIALGFTLWYKKDQSYKDRLLQAEVEKKTMNK